MKYWLLRQWKFFDISWLDEHIAVQYVAKRASRIEEIQATVDIIPLSPKSLSHVFKSLQRD